MPISLSIRATTRDDTLDPSVDRLKGHRLSAIPSPTSLGLVHLTTRGDAPGHVGEVGIDAQDLTHDRWLDLTCPPKDPSGLRGPYGGRLLTGCLRMGLGMIAQGYGLPPSCLAFGQERFDRLVKGAAPLLDLLIADECHGIPDQIFLLLRNTPARAEVQKGIGCNVCRI
jgi:hypothetical protein